MIKASNAAVREPIGLQDSTGSEGSLPYTTADAVVEAQSPKRKPVAEEDLLDPRTPLSQKQRKLVKAMIEQPTLAKAALRAGYTPQHASQLMKQPKMLTALQTAMERAGITDELLASRIREGLDATRPSSHGGEAHPDFGVRKQYLDQAMKVRGDLKDGQEITHKHITINITPELVRGLLDSKAIDEEDVQELVLCDDGSYA